MDELTLHDLVAGYALDALDENDVREFETHLGHCESCRAELASLSETTAALAYGVESAPPPPALRERILEQARGERINVIPLRPRWALRAAASVAAVAAATAIGLGLWGSGLSGKLDRSQQARANQERVAEIFAQPDARRIPFQADRGTLIVGRSGEAALVMNQLPRTDKGMTYEAWVAENGKPLPAGVFQGGRDVVLFPLTRPVPNGAFVMVTRERAGGVSIPAHAPIVRVQAVAG